MRQHTLTPQLLNLCLSFRQQLAKPKYTSIKHIWATQISNKSHVHPSTHGFRSDVVTECCGRNHNTHLPHWMLNDERFYIFLLFSTILLFIVHNEPDSRAERERGWREDDLQHAKHSFVGRSIIRIFSFYIVLQMPAFIIISALFTVVWFSFLIFFCFSLNGIRAPSSLRADSYVVEYWASGWIWCLQFWLCQLTPLVSFLIRLIFIVIFSQ